MKPQGLQRSIEEGGEERVAVLQENVALRKVRGLLGVQHVCDARWAADHAPTQHWKPMHVTVQLPQANGVLTQQLEVYATHIQKEGERVKALDELKEKIEAQVSG